MIGCVEHAMGLALALMGGVVAVFAVVAMIVTLKGK
jgi:hypothetical protein